MARTEDCACTGDDVLGLGEKGREVAVDADGHEPTHLREQRESLFGLLARRNVDGVDRRSTVRARIYPAFIPVGRGISTCLHTQPRVCVVEYHRSLAA